MYKPIIAIGTFLVGMAAYGLVHQEPISIPFSYDNGEIFVQARINGEWMRSLIDTGATISMMNARLPHPPSYENMEVVDFQGDVKLIPVVDMEVCIESYCENEKVGLINGLDEDMLLQGSLLEHFDRAVIDYKTRTLTLEDE